VKEKQETPMEQGEVSEAPQEAPQPLEQEAVDMEFSAPLYSIDYEVVVFS